MCICVRHLATICAASSGIRYSREPLVLGGGSGTSEAVISVMCFTTWMDGGKDRSMDG